jgi:hypothetical protein
MAKMFSAGQKPGGTLSELQEGSMLKKRKKDQGRKPMVSLV